MLDVWLKEKYEKYKYLLSFKVLYNIINDKIFLPISSIIFTIQFKSIMKFYDFKIFFFRYKYLFTTEEGFEEFISITREKLKKENLRRIYLKFREKVSFKNIKFILKKKIIVSKIKFKKKIKIREITFLERLFIKKYLKHYNFDNAFTRKYRDFIWSRKYMKLFSRYYINIYKEDFKNSAFYFFYNSIILLLLSYIGILLYFD